MKKEDIQALEGDALKTAALDLLAQYEAKSKEVEALEGSLEKLSKKLSDAEKAGFVKLTVEIGTKANKKEYEVLSGAKVGGVKYTAEELAKNTEACQALLKIDGQGILKEVTE
jgi:hypothetical protein